MKKETRNIIIGLLLMAGGLYGSTLKIDTPWHYFGTGTVFGIGLSLAAAELYRKYSSKINKP